MRLTPKSLNINMKTFKSLILPVLLLSFCFTAKAQTTLPDTIRIGVGLEGMADNGTFGSSYKYGAGVSLRIDVPITKSVYVTASAGYNNFFASAGATNSPYTIQNVPVPNFKTIPLKLGVKWFLFPTFYIQGEAGETILSNKSELYAVSSTAFTWSPQFGLIFPLKNRRTYIDTGVRYEGVASFNNDAFKNNFWAVHVAYAFNL